MLFGRGKIQCFVKEGLDPFPTRAVHFGNPTISQQPTPLKAPHLAEESRIQEPEFRRRRARAPYQILTSGFWILRNSRSDRGDAGVFITFGGPNRPMGTPLK